ISGHLNFTDINKAFDLLHKGESIRTILTYED
ncbi:alcohol dehydrogenase, partial [Brevibacillus sp. 179-C 1.1 NHS]